MKQLFLLLLALGSPTLAIAQDMRQDTYCNPLNIDYTYMIYNSDKDISYRSGADPAVVRFRGEYYMFVTRSNGYWHSKDLLDWDFIAPKDWYPQGSNAPAAHNYKDSVLYVTGDPSGSMSILYSDNPKSGEWKATPAILHNLQDPDLFIDDDGKAYMFWGSSNVYPIRGMELDKNHRFLPKGGVKELFNLDMPRHGWERFGENHSDTVLGGYIEGPWLTKHNGKYYMQYGAPGTEFNVYADGVYVADHPMGPYTYQKQNANTLRRAPEPYCRVRLRSYIPPVCMTRDCASDRCKAPSTSTGNVGSACFLPDSKKTVLCTWTPASVIIPAMLRPYPARRGSSVDGCSFLIANR